MGALIDRLITASLRHRPYVLGATLLLAVAGAWSFATLNTDAFPDLSPNQVLVMTTVPGLSPAEVEQQVTLPDGSRHAGHPAHHGGPLDLQGGLSVVTLDFEEDVDFYFVRTQVQQRMQDARGVLPPDAEPMLGPPATAMGEVFQYLVESTDSTPRAEPDTVTLLALTNAQEYIIKPLLRTVPGVADVNSWGGMLQRFEVLADPGPARGLPAEPGRPRAGDRRQQRQLRRRLHRGPG